MTDITTEYHGVMLHVYQEDNLRTIVTINYYRHDNKIGGFNLVFSPEDLQYDNGVPYYEYKYGNIVHADHTPNTMLNDLTMYCMQAIMYLCSKEPDIVENPEQKRIYKPSTNIRNKYTEIRKWDVGVRIGNTLRMNQQPQSSTSPSCHTGSRKRPHTRRAHWHHYWTGRGKINLELRWIEPTFVGNKTDIVVTKHDVV